MRILVASQIFEEGYYRGAERVAMNTAKWLSDRHAVEILSLGQESGMDIVQGVPVHRLRFEIVPLPAARTLDRGTLGKMAWHMRNAFGGVSRGALRRCLDAIAPDVLYAHKATAFMPQLLEVCTERRLPVVLHLHDYSMLCPRTTMYRFGGNCAKPCLSCRGLTARWRHRSDAVGDVIAVSAFLRDRHLRYGAFPKARWHVMHNTDSTTLEGFARKSGSDFTFGFIGALTPQKGFDDLVTAFAALPESADARLVVAGTGDETYVAAAKSKLVGRPVEWLGQVQPNAFYSGVDCVVVPSRWNEPQGLVVGEAMRRGLPVIASDRGGISEVIGPRHGHMLYDPDAPGALSQAMEAMQRRRPDVAAEALNPDFYGSVEATLEKSVMNADRIGH